jgi:hypothetical protein
MYKTRMKRWSVEFTRTITITYTVRVKAVSNNAARDRVQAHHDLGRFGQPRIEFNGAIGMAKAAEISEPDDDIVIDGVSLELTNINTQASDRPE